MNRLACLGAAALALTIGCYSVEPVTRAKPAPGARVEMSINDAGRVALGGSMGPEIRRVEGNLLSQQDNEYVVSVRGVNYLNGVFQPWKGETVRINSNMVAGLYERKFSKGRTVALVGVVAVAAATIRLPWIKSALSDDDTPPPIGDQMRRPITQIRFVLHR